MITNSTIVSAHINIKRNDNVNYFEHGKRFLLIDACKIVFMDRVNINIFNEYQNEKTIFIVFEKEDMLMWNIAGSTRLPSVRDKQKDTKENMMHLNTKTEWMRRAIEIDPFNTADFIWIDFGISHMIGDLDAVPKLITRMGRTKTISDKIRIPQIWTHFDTGTLLDQISCFFIGCVFGGNKKTLIKFNQLANDMFRKVVVMEYIIWEVNVWYLVYMQNKHMFDMYISDHDISMLQAY